MHTFTLSETDTGPTIYVNLISSPAGQYLSRRPHLIGLITELLANTELRGKRIVIEHDMGRDIGTTDVVTTTEADTIYYAQPVKSQVFSRFAKNRYPQPSSRLTITIVKDADDNYEVTDAWIGSDHPAFPGDEHETRASKTYWQTHALVQDAQPVQSRSITKTCPY